MFAECVRDPGLVEDVGVAPREIADDYVGAKDQAEDILNDG